MRARGAGIVIGSLPTGVHNAITDVSGVSVGQRSLIRGQGPLVPGVGPVRTGVTAIRPHPGDLFRSKVAACVHRLNGFGEVTNSEMVRETGVLESPIILTGTSSVPRAADGLLDWLLARDRELGISTWTPAPMVAECSDQFLHDMRGRHVTAADVAAALDTASTGPVAEGGVGAGVGMSCCEFKGGIGTSSRRIPEGYIVGVLVLSNFGRREHLRIDGVPVGLALRDWAPPSEHPDASGSSIIIVLATDAPLDPRQLERVSVRAGAGLARAGGLHSTTSGDFVIAFSTSNRVAHEATSRVIEQRLVPEAIRASEPGSPPVINQLFQAAIEATEEAILNSLFSAQTLDGRDGHILQALPIPETLAILRAHGRLT